MLHRIDHAQGVLAVAHDDYAAHRFLLTVQLRDPEPQIGPDRHARDIADANRAPPSTCPERDLRDVFHAAEIAKPANRVIRARNFNRARADVLVCPSHCFDHLTSFDAVPEQSRRVKQHLILAHVPTQARDLGDTGHGLQHVPNLEILNRAEPIWWIARTCERVLEDPSHAGGVGSEAGLGSGRQATLDGVEVLEHPRPRPIEVGSVLKDHIHE